MRQELMRTLRIRISFLSVSVKIPNLKTLRNMLIMLLGTDAFASGTDACTEHTCQELMRMLSLRNRNYMMPSSIKKLKYQVYILAPKSPTQKGFMV
jgi:hypothetical protein